ncbi:MAG: response regulator transcription factor [Prevotella sp.]|nr:response regulator transcription factor [Prevotella sp.]
MTCIIVDDEPLAVKLLESYVARTPELQLMGSYTDSVEAMTAIKSLAVDLLFLDIQMPDINGMELARLIPEKTRVIFTTAFKEYAFESYEVSALDFLLKPIRYNKFIAAVEKAQRWFSRETETAVTTAPAGRDNIFIRVDGELRQLNMSDIMYVSGMKDYVVFYLDDGSKLITHITMKAVEDMLPASDFLRIHRSYIVALKKIRSVDRNNCVYIGKEIIHVTDSYRPPFDAYLQKNML